MDTDVVVAAMRSPAGASAALVRAVRRGELILLLSVALALEYEAVCTRAEHRAAAGLSQGEVQIFLDTLIASGPPTETHFFWRPQLRDASDEMVLEVAVNGHAEMLVTFNARDYGTAPARFGIKVHSPSEAVRRIRLHEGH